MNKFEKLFEYYKGLPKGINSSIHYSLIRLIKAEEESKKTPVEIKKIIKYTNEFLNILKMKQIANPLLDLTNEKINYKQIKESSCIKDERDIVWMKFTKDKYLGVVATSNDVNFNIPNSIEQYNVKKNNKWVYNTSGIIIHHLHKEWDESFVLVFPLINIPKSLNRGDIERGIGNYLIYKNIPILDFYSHNY